jgi:hypothetical protein
MGTESTKALTWIKYLAIFFAGVITNFSGVFEGIIKLPANYYDFKRIYLYDKDLLNGSWSTNANYILNSREVGLDKEQPSIVLTLTINDDGSVDGEILSEKICDALPLTWNISVESKSPNLKNLFVDRSFFIKQLHNGEMETVAELKLVNQNKRYRTITLETINDATNSLPNLLTLGKDLPSYKDDFEKLSNYCADSPTRFRESIKKSSRSAQKP